MLLTRIKTIIPAEVKSLHQTEKQTKRGEPIFEIKLSIVEEDKYGELETKEFFAKSYGPVCPVKKGEKGNLKCEMSAFQGMLMTTVKGWSDLAKK